MRKNLITPYGLSKDELKKFHSSLREVLTFIKYSKDREKMDEAVRDNFKKLRKEEIDVLNYCANVNLKLLPGEETGGIFLKLTYREKFSEEFLNDENDEGTESSPEMEDEETTIQGGF